ncbi:hypothetical protein [Oleidesulfovibrio alaskensis]|jgi:hypothetical protein|uniref:hypothetical protein n=1 Tax=Oleidesulfovibrio alaskensis TaxID=58180 RepID=UPI0004208470|nr:hypothetical protein [Oleidesulfovibrio alaskensis]MBL3581352.1 hypothetical protein [Oleidesulfovibrio alaskensis]
MSRLFAAVLLILCTAVPARAQLPLSIAGFTLGEPVSGYEDKVMPETKQADRDALFVDEVSLRDDAVPCIRGGSLISGNCLGENRLIGIKLKFADRSKSLYDRLEKAYRKKFGEPANWIGDPFHNVLAWEWILREGDDVLSVVLAYSVVADMRPGVSIKMMLRSDWDRENACYTRKNAHGRRMMEKHSVIVDDLSPFIPHQ